jgi:hypothetical protein
MLQDTTQKFVEAWFILAIASLARTVTVCCPGMSIKKRICLSSLPRENTPVPIPPGVICDTKNAETGRRIKSFSKSLQDATNGSNKGKFSISESPKPISEAYESSPK